MRETLDIYINKGKEEVNTCCCNIIDTTVYKDRGLQLPVRKWADAGLL